MPSEPFLLTHPTAYLSSTYRSALVMSCDSVMTRLNDVTPQLRDTEE